MSLVEVLIVVAILGILAALVSGRYQGWDEDARLNAAETNLRLIGDALVRYKVDHGYYPTINQVWDNLILKTDAHGNLAEAGHFGPYITQPPTNPWTYLDIVDQPDSDIDATGYTYDPVTGKVLIPGYNQTIRKYTGPRLSPGEARIIKLAREADNAASSSGDNDDPSYGGYSHTSN
ncbi:MAG: type II secretion system protein GspG [Phycisphaeraceae bacterium]